MPKGNYSTSLWHKRSQALIGLIPYPMICRPFWASIRCFCAISFGILALFWSVFLLHKIYGAQIGALVNNAVEVGEKLAELRDGWYSQWRTCHLLDALEDVGSRHVFSLTRVLAHLEAQTEILLGRREKLILPIVGNLFGCFLLVKPISLALGYDIARLGIL